ncbi:polysaccharide lyase [Paraflavitalea sp. CAU 1676]|uniref:polysaccharide lyase n=1 Tax=Paraflavitalea sp. CAU 1676 TaxID=3032598 RepID=UPI0023DCC3D4|nr:hypothetical protein [Paraflavitalea sp. CAU 1676]MDF2190401.1 hypothetical protein [Paraflavitalea sp. CAU 1676]
MQIKTSKHHVTAACLLILCLSIVSCQKQSIKEQPAEDAVAGGTPEDVELNAINSSFSENWDSYTHGSQYTTAQASADFGNISGWNQGRSMISNGNLRVTLEPNALSGAGGIVSNIDVSDGSAYELDYDIRFHSAFDWSRGGKLGFGFAIGEGNAGGDPAWDGNGGTLRLMWYNNNGRVYFHPYVYYRDQPGQYGDNFGKSYPSSGSLNKSQTYHVHMYIKSNTGSSTNGRAQIIIDGTTLLDIPIRWTTNDAQRLIRNVTFHTFRGGSQDYWMSSTVGYIYYDNLVVNKIS